MSLTRSKTKPKATLLEDVSATGWIQKLTGIADLTLKVLSCGAILATGVWAYYQYNLGGSNNWMANISIDTEVLPYGEKKRLLVIHLKTKNPRPILLEFDKPESFYNLTVSKIPDDLKENASFDETAGKEIAKFDLMNNYGYALVPNAEFDDMRAVIVATGTTILVSALLEEKNGELSSKASPENDFVSTSKIIHIDEK